MCTLLTAIMCEKGDLAANLATHMSLVRQAAESGCDLVVFPEFSLTGSVDPVRHPERAVAIDDPTIMALTQVAHDHDVATVFGFVEHAGDEFFITQAVARDGAINGLQRKRHLGDDEVGYSTAGEALVFELDGRRIGIIICAEANVEWTWDATCAAGADTVLFCSAPGLDDPRPTEAALRAGFDWWEGFGLAHARRHARRLGLTVAMATQAGTTVDENFPGIAALGVARGHRARSSPRLASGHARRRPLIRDSRAVQFLRGYRSTREPGASHVT